MIIKKLDFKPIEKEATFSISNLVQAAFDSNTGLAGEAINDEKNKTTINPDSNSKTDVPKKCDANEVNIPDDNSVCEFCQKPIPTENLTLHQVHCERMQIRRAKMKASENERAAQNKANQQNSKSKKNKSKSGQKLGTGKNKPKNVVKEEDIDDLLDSVINDNKLCSDKNCKIKVSVTGLFCPNCRRLFCTTHQLPEVHNCKDKADRRGMIDNSGAGALKGNLGSYTTVQSRSKQVKQAQLKNRLNNKLQDMESDRKSSKSKKKSFLKCN